MQSLHIGSVKICPDIRQGDLHSIGQVLVGDMPLRADSTRFLPWFDTIEGDIFNAFAIQEIEVQGGRVILHTRARSSNDYPFRERRDSSGDICFRDVNWDAPCREADMRIVFEPADAVVDGRGFTGFRYWFEYDGELPIHRLIDRATWEAGGALADHTICLRNWLTPPRCRLDRNSFYSTVGLHQAPNVPMPGNLWARWSLLPGFDMVYSRSQGIVLGWYDDVSCIRSVLETTAGEDCLRVIDLHLFASTTRMTTNPKTILWCPDRVDDIEALNLWTRLTDRDHDLACRAFSVDPAQDGPPRIQFDKNVWVDMHFDRSYEDVVELAGEFGAECVFIDPIWEHGQALAIELKRLIPDEQWEQTLLKKLFPMSMVCTIDFNVAEALGGETGLKALCDRAAAHGVQVLSWMATHAWPQSFLRSPRFLKRVGLDHLGAGSFGVFAARESGRHPDTGYAGDCWTLNLNRPVAEYMTEKMLGICERTGLAGFLWDSFSNIGWWQVDYSDNSLRPQFDRMGRLYADLCNAGLYLQPEGMAAFSNHNCIDQWGGEIYAGDDMGFAYNSTIAVSHEADPALGKRDAAILRGVRPIDYLFRAFAHKWVPRSEMWRVPREAWDADAVAEIKRLYATYKAVRHQMITRTVLHDDAGVLWEDGSDEAVFFCFTPREYAAPCRDALTGEAISAGSLQANRVYRIASRDGASLSTSREKTCALREEAQRTEL